MNLLVAWDRLNADDVELIRQRTGAQILQPESQEQVADLVPEAQVIFGFINPSLLANAVNCQWLQIPYAGVERVVSVPWGNPKMVLTNGSGVFGPNIAEHVIGMLLAFNRGLHIARGLSAQPNLAVGRALSVPGTDRSLRGYIGIWRHRSAYRQAVGGV